MFFALFSLRLKLISIIRASPTHTDLKVYHWARALGFINHERLHLNLIRVPSLLWYDSPPRKSIHDPAFPRVPLIPLPELGWIVWNKLQSSLREGSSDGGRGGGVKAERIKDAKAKVEDPTEQEVELATLSPVLGFLQLLSLIIFNTLSLIHHPSTQSVSLHCSPRPLGGAAAVLLCGVCSGLIHLFVFWIHNLQR